MKAYSDAAPYVTFLLYMKTQNIQRIQIYQTCRFLREIYFHFPQLQTIVELGANGLEALGSNLSNAHILTSIRNRRDAWMHMSFKQPAPVLRMSGETRAYEIVAGVYCQVDENYLTVINLDAPDEKLKEKMFEIGLDRVRDFAMDPTQNVIALVRDNPVG